MSDLERRLAAIWSEVLELSQLRRDDNFFDIGGNSLLAVRVAAHMRTEFHLNLPLQLLFEAPTISALAAHVLDISASASGANSSETNRARIVPRSRSRSGSTPLPMSFGQQQLWLAEEVEGGSAMFNVPCLVQLDGPLDLAALEWSLNAIVARHESLRTTFSVVDGQPMQQVHPSRPLVMPLADLERWASERREVVARVLAQRMARRRFDLERGPLIRARVLRLGAQRHWLVLVLHHIVTDGWSLGVLYSELGRGYEAYCRGRQVVLEELPVQFADYAC
jgi:hypothetical protein